MILYWTDLIRGENLRIDRNPYGNTCIKKPQGDADSEEADGDSEGLHIVVER